MFHLLKTFLESGILVSGVSIVWEDTNCCAKKNRCDLGIYLMSVLSSSHGIIIYRAIHAPGHGNNVADILNATEKRYLKGEMGIIGELGSNNTTKIGMIPSALKYDSIKYAYQCLHILNDKEILNGLKCSTKLKNIESLFKYKSRKYNVQRNSGVNLQRYKMR